MTIGDRPDICIHHAPCLDGFSAAWAIWQKWPDVEFFPGVYGEDPPLEAATGKAVLIVDFSYPEADLLALAEVARSVTVLDHHLGAKDTLLKLGGFTADEDGASNKVIEVTYDESRSGAVLAWNYAWASNPPRLIAHVQDRDLWLFNMPETREITAVLSSHDMDFATWTRLAKEIEHEGDRMRLIAEGAAILRSTEQQIRALLEVSARMMNIEGHDVPCANVPPMWASEAGNLMSQNYPFAVTYFDRADGIRQYSLRSAEEGEDVNAVAKRFGGGGHKHAAGFSVPLPDAMPLKGGRGKVERVD